jgi:hypothetical protein
MISRRFTRKAMVAAAVSAGAVAAAATVALAVPAGASTMSAAIHRYSFQTIDNQRDVTFNQLLGINEVGKIAGYFGSGMAGHPNKGYTVTFPYHQSNFKNENFPHSVQTQVTGLNDLGQTVGFYVPVSPAGANLGFYRGANGKFHNVTTPPGAANASPEVDQLLGINDHGVAVGFYTNSAGDNRGYTYNIHSHKYSRVRAPGSSLGLTGTSLTAAAINNHGTIAGFYVNAKGVTVAFVKAGNHFITIVKKGATMTQAFGINDSGEVVGAYTFGTGTSAKSFGFTWTRSHGFTKVNDPKGIGSTIINGVNNRGELVGFYMDAAGNTHGFLARPLS